MKVEQISNPVSNPAKNDPSLHTREMALSLFQNFKPGVYATTRNFLDGHNSRLSISIKHGVLTNPEIFQLNKQNYSSIDCEKFIQELACRELLRSYPEHNPDPIWIVGEEYRTGFQTSEYSDKLPTAILLGQTSNVVINQVILDLVITG